MKKREKNVSTTKCLPILGYLDGSSTGQRNSKFLFTHLSAEMCSLQITKSEAISKLIIEYFLLLQNGDLLMTQCYQE